MTGSSVAFTPPVAVRAIFLAFLQVGLTLKRTTPTEANLFHWGHLKGGIDCSKHR